MTGGEHAARRSARWRAVWTDRSAELADWNGYESAFASPDAYERWMWTVVNLLRRRIGLSSDDVVVDLGCGTGRITEKVAPLVSSIVGYDYSETALEVASRLHPAGNVEYRLGDLGEVPLGEIGAAKVYAIGSLLYLDSSERALELIEHCRAQGIDFAAMDLPDARVVDPRPRPYDRAVYDHLQFDAEEIVRRFPGAQIERGAFPGYVNGPYRFNLYLRGNGSGA